MLRPFMSAALALAIASTASLAQTSTFTYQGELKDNGQPANGSYDLQFALTDSLTGGNTLNTICVNDLPVAGGRFTVPLDFGSFRVGNPYYIEVRARRHTAGRDCNTSTGFTPLTPRQELTSAPLASAAWRAANLSASDGSPTSAVFTDTSGNAFANFNVSVFGRLGVGFATTPSGPLEVRSGSNSFFYVDSPNGDVHFNGGNDGAFGFFNDGPAAGGTYFIGANNTRPLSLLNNGNVGIGTVTPGKTLTVAGDMEVGVRNDDYRSIRLGGGNSSGFLYGSYPVLGDGIHMGYNWYANASSGIIIAADGGTSRITTGYGYIGLATGGVGAPPVDRLTVKDNGWIGVNIANPASLFHVNGNIRCVNVTQTSSAAFKDNITPLSAGLDELMKLVPVSYTWNEKAPAEARGKHDLGFIAEEVVNVLPDAVALDDHGAAAGIDYSRITVLAVQAIKQQQKKSEADRAEIQSLRERLEQLEAQLNTRK